MRIVFDLDGTLADGAHRLHFLEAKDWRGYFAACMGDAPIVKMIRLARELAVENHVEIWSGRSDEVRQQTECWLAMHGVPYRRLLMRTAGDYTEDHVLKSSWLDWITKDEWPDIVFDDRNRVVDMWRSRGIICCQVAPGDF